MVSKIYKNIFKIIKGNKSLFSFLKYIRYILNRYILRGYLKSYHLFLKKTEITCVEDKSVSFFGYYNITPENNKGEIVYLKVSEEQKRGSLYETANIIIKNNNSILKIAETNSWNWQQGCMLQWMPNNQNLIIFNDYDIKRAIYISKIIDTEGNMIKTYNMPIYTISKCEEFALTLNFDRLSTMRPDYGYFNKENKSLPLDYNDGIWNINLASGEITLIITLDQLAKISPSKTMHGAIHKVNHIDINPSGSRFMFLHRWIGKDGRYMRLITADINGANIQILNGDNMISHCCWLNDNEILSFCEVNNKTGYFKFIDKTSDVTLYSIKFPKIDGHPSISPDKRYIVTDTYPDKSRFSSLYIYDIKHDKLNIVGRFYQPLRYRKEKRIDLHPKWGYDSKVIYFESGHNKTRKLYKLLLK